MVRHLDDAALVAAAQGGDRFALDQLLRRHYERIHAVCRRIAGTSKDADDACQEALIKIVRNLPRFDGRSSFGTWAYRIATNASLDELRKRHRRPALHAVGEDERQEVADPTATKPNESFNDRLVLDDALSRLPNDLRVAVVLRDVADLDYAEIAETLDVPIGTVKSRISRGRAALAGELRLVDPDMLRRIDTVDPAPPESPDDHRGNRGASPERPSDLT